MGVKRWPRQRGMRIKSIQRGTITMSDPTLAATATITAVVTALAEVFHLGNAPSSNATSAFNGSQCRLELTNSTTVTATRATSAAGNGTITVGYEVVEWEAAPVGRAMRIKSIQRGTVTLNAGFPNPVTITAVDTTRAILKDLRLAIGGTVSSQPWWAFTNATTITATVAGTSATTINAYEVIEWEEINVAA